MSFSNIKLFWFYCFFHRNQSRSRHSFLEWAIDGDVSTVEEILHARMPVDCADVLDPMALIKAGQFNRTDVIRLLLQRGADVHKPNHFGNTPVHLAAIRNSTDAIALLFKHGASINITKNWNNLKPDCYTLVFSLLNSILVY